MGCCGLKYFALFFLFLDSFISVKIMNEILKMNDYIR